MPMQKTIRLRSRLQRAPGCFEYTGGRELPREDNLRGQATMREILLCILCRHVDALGSRDQTFFMFISFLFQRGGM